MNKKIVLFLLLMVSLSSCFVKEDRRFCPGRLILDFSSLDTSVVRYVDIHCRGEYGVLFSDRLMAEEFDEEYVREVPRGYVRVNIWNAAEERSAIVRTGGLIIPYGCECPYLYTGSSLIDIRGESAREVMSVHKNYCLLTIEVEGMERNPYSFTLKGNVGGYGPDGTPSGGKFACVAYPVGNAGARVSLPRQMDDSLLLEVEDGSGYVKTFAVGEYMRQSGYDWTKADLEDVTIVIDYYVTSIKLTVQGWKEEYVYDIVL